MAWNIVHFAGVGYLLERKAVKEKYLMVGKRVVANGICKSGSIVLILAAEVEYLWKKSQNSDVL